MKRLNYFETGDRSVELTDLQLYHADVDGYCLSAKYRVEDEHSIKEVYIPKIRLGVRSNWVMVNYLNSIFDSCDVDHSRYTADLGFGTCQMLPEKINGYNVCFTETTIKEKHHEMTIAEIEEKLGYKIKIVGEKE